ncbi:MAG: putative IIA-like nitrogen-regulatory protein PtsN [Acidobacteria bacterium]|nr:putative IIA-like nitrogen-regulatory protein PtsN [Acidobacteriota bacterium]
MTDRERLPEGGHTVSETEVASDVEAADPQLAEIFDASHVVAEIGAAGRDGVIGKLVKAVEGQGLLTDAKWLETALKERERMVPTAMPNGVAFMHARHRAADKFPRQFLFLARSAKGVAFGSPDEKPTHLFFLLALRKDMAHLRWLARLSWICRNRATVSSLLKAKTADDIARILRIAVEELPGNLKQK